MGERRSGWGLYLERWGEREEIRGEGLKRDVREEMEAR